MKRRFGWLAPLFCLLLVASPGGATGSPLPGGSGFGYDAGDLGASFTALPCCLAPWMSYDVDSGAFALNVAASPWHLRRTDGSVLASDMIGQFSLTAVIDRSGTVRSGAFNWIGQSTMLGMAVPTLLLSGAPIDVVIAESQGFGFDFLALVDFVHPVFESLLGSVNSLLIETFAPPLNSAFFNDPWNASFGGFAGDSGPDLAGSPRSIPAAGSLWTLALGLIGLGLLVRRRPGMAPRPAF